MTAGGPLTQADKNKFKSRNKDIPEDVVFDNTGPFSYCKLIEVIIIPNAVRAIKVGAFCGCRRLMRRVILGKGLEEIGMNAFGECTSMVEIVIPSAIRDIDDAAFLGCTNLRRVKFCDEIEEFVSSHAMRVWWNQGRHERSLCTYRFLVRCRIPVQFVGLAPISSWQANINDMLRIMPTIYNWDMDNYFNKIDSRITLDESWRQVPTLLGEIIPNNDTVL